MPLLHSVNNFAPLFINESPESNSSYALKLENNFSVIHFLILLPLVLDTSWSGNDNSWSAISLQQLPAKGHSIWMSQFRLLILVRSIQSLTCSIQEQQVSSSTQSSCDIITWPCNCWHGLFLCTVWMELPMSREPFAMPSTWYCDIMTTLSEPSLQLLDWAKARWFLASAGSVSTILKSTGPQVKWKWVTALPDVTLVSTKLHRIAKFARPLQWRFAHVRWAPPWPRGGLVWDSWWIPDLCTDDDSADDDDSMEELIEDGDHNYNLYSMHTASHSKWTAYGIEIHKLVA